MWTLRGRKLAHVIGITILAIGAICPTGRVNAGGLSCSIGEIVINNLKIGQTYSLSTLANLPLAVTNTGDYVVRVAVESVKPSTADLRQNAIPVTDASWAWAIPDTFNLTSKETKLVEIVIAIPDDESLFGAKFQVGIWTHSIPGPGEMLAYGLMSRVIFTIDATRELDGVVPTGDLGISLAPDEIIMKDLVRGPEYSLDEFLTEPMSVLNTTGQTLAIEVSALSSQLSVASPMPGYDDLLRVATVVFTPTEFLLEPGERRVITGIVTFPADSETAGTNFMCVVSAAVVGLSVQTQTYSRIYAHLK